MNLPAGHSHTARADTRLQAVRHESQVAVERSDMERPFGIGIPQPASTFARNVADMSHPVCEANAVRGGARSPVSCAIGRPFQRRSHAAASTRPRIAPSTVDFPAPSAGDHREAASADGKVNIARARDRGDGAHLKSPDLLTEYPHPCGSAELGGSPSRLVVSDHAPVRRGQPACSCSHGRTTLTCMRCIGVDDLSDRPAPGPGP